MSFDPALFVLALSVQNGLRLAPKKAGKGVDDRGNPLFDGKRTSPHGPLSSLLKGKLPYEKEVDLNNE